MQSHETIIKYPFASLPRRLASADLLVCPCGCKNFLLKNKISSGIVLPVGVNKSVVGPLLAVSAVMATASGERWAEAWRDYDVGATFVVRMHVLAAAVVKDTAKHAAVSACKNVLDNQHEHDMVCVAWTSRLSLGAAESLTSAAWRPPAC